MRIIKKGISILLVVFMILCLTRSYFNYEKILEINKNYEEYYNEDANIIVKLKGGKGSLSGGNTYQYNDYNQQFQHVNDTYKEISKNENVESMNISYYLQIGGTENIVSENYFNFSNLQLIQGRYFAEEELENGERVAIVSSWYATNKFENAIHVGDEIEITQYDDTRFETIKVKVIGIFKNTDEWIDNNFVDAYIFMPTSTMKQISNIWLENAKDDPNYLKYFLPMGILDPILTFKNEKEYDTFIDNITEYNNNLEFSFNCIRLDDHKLPTNKFNTIVYESNLKMSIIVSIVFLTLEVINAYIKTKTQRKFERQLLVEQEKNVQNILTINQDSHKLKHDLKHFLSHITNLLEKEDVDTAIKLLSEYYQEIENLDIPAFTHNRTIDLVINTYKSKANKQNINFTYSSTLIQSLPIIDRKLYILLSNALDNAFTHCDENKKIELSINNIGNYYRFIITNSTNEEKIKKNIIPYKEHGFGTISMIQIIKEIDGEITNEIIDGNYICTILIPIRNNDFE